MLGQDWRASGGNGFTWLNAAAFDATGPARDRRFGTLGFNTARGPGAFNWGVGIHKTIPIHEKHRVMFRLEMFNVLNHMMWNDPGLSLQDPANFGTLASQFNAQTLGGSLASANYTRIIQVGLRVYF